MTRSEARGSLTGSVCLSASLRGGPHWVWPGEDDDDDDGDIDDDDNDDDDYDDNDDDDYDENDDDDDPIEFHPLPPRQLT